MADSNNTMARLKQYISGEFIGSIEDLLSACHRIRASNESDKEELVRFANAYFITGPRREHIDEIDARTKCLYPNPKRF